jgi:hypothetical protein
MATKSFHIGELRAGMFCLPAIMERAFSPLKSSFGAEQIESVYGIMLQLMPMLVSMELLIRPP